MSSNVLNNKIKTLGMIAWRDAEWFQPKEFKTTSKDNLQKLKNSLINNGFAAPFYVWQRGKKNVILDGTRRDIALKELESEGHTIPDTLPAIYVDVKNAKQAKKFLLIYNAEYGKINNDIMIDFISDIDIDEITKEINIPDIDFKFDVVDNEKEIDENELELKNECPKCGFKF